MPELPAKPTKSKPVKEEKKRSRSPIERIVVWAVILGLAGVAYYEYSKRADYDAHMNVISEALNREEGEGDVTYDDIRANLTEQPEITPTNFGGAEADLYTWRWKGLKEYKIELLVAKESGVLITLKQE